MLTETTGDAESVVWDGGEFGHRCVLTLTNQPDDQTRQSNALNK
jgi:hypothetical protein